MTTDARAFHIRPMGEHDIDHVSTLVRASAHGAYPYPASSGISAWIEGTYGPDAYEQRLRDERCWPLVATGSDGEILGVAEAAGISDTTAHYFGLYVEGKGAGIGTALTEARDRLVRSVGLRSGQCHVLCVNAHRVSWFQSRGWTLAHREPHTHPETPIQGAEIIVLKRELTR